MTIKEYISQKFAPFGSLSEAQLFDMSMNGGFGLDDEYEESNTRAVGIAMISAIEELVFSPKVKSVSENGFSISWDFDSLGRYYLWLCRHWGVTPNDDALDILGISMIINRTDIW